MGPFDTRNRLKPFLIDRLRDDRSANAQSVSPQEYRALLMRDLELLFSTIAPAEDSGLNDLPHASRSVLNYGVRELESLRRDQVMRGELERRVAQAIERFEPRLSARSVSVHVMDSEESLASIELLIDGELWMLPAPEPIRLRASLDPETGRCAVRPM